MEKKQSFEEWKQAVWDCARTVYGWEGDNPCDDVEDEQNLEFYNDGEDPEQYFYEGWIND